MLGSYQKVEKAVEHVSESDTNTLVTVPKETWGTGDQRKNWNNPASSLLKLAWILKSPKGHEESCSRSDLG